MVSQNITADVAEVGEQLSCTYRRAPQVTLKASSEPDLADFETGHTGDPRCGGWAWIAERGTAGAEVGGDGS